MNQARKIVLVIYLLVMTGIGIYVPWQWGRIDAPHPVGYRTLWTLAGEKPGARPNFNLIFLESLTATSLCGIGILLTTRETCAPRRTP